MIFGLPTFSILFASWNPFHLHLFSATITCQPLTLEPKDRAGCSAHFHLTSRGIHTLMPNKKQDPSLSSCLPGVKFGRRSFHTGYFICRAITPSTRPLYLGSKTERSSTSFLQQLAAFHSRDHLQTSPHLFIPL